MEVVAPSAVPTANEWCIGTPTSNKAEKEEEERKENKLYPHAKGNEEGTVIVMAADQALRVSKEDVQNDVSQKVNKGLYALVKSCQENEPVNVHRKVMAHPNP